MSSSHVMCIEAYLARLVYKGLGKLESGSIPLLLLSTSLTMVLYFEIRKPGNTQVIEKIPKKNPCKCDSQGGT